MENLFHGFAHFDCTARYLRRVFSVACRQATGLLHRHPAQKLFKQMVHLSSVGGGPSLESALILPKQRLIHRENEIRTRGELFGSKLFGL